MVRSCRLESGSAERSCGLRRIVAASRSDAPTSRSAKGDPMNTDTYRAYKFFREHAGGIIGRNAETALDLARAEQLLDEAEDLGIGGTEWPYDEEPYEGFDVFTDEEIATKFESNEWTGPFGCIVRAGDESTSLWGIVLSPKEIGDPYARVVRAELASELMDELRQAIGDTLDYAEEVCSA